MLLQEEGREGEEMNDESESENESSPTNEKRDRGEHEHEYSDNQVCRLDHFERFCDLGFCLNGIQL